MKELIRDSIFGQVVRVISGKRLFTYPEERDPEHWKKFINEEKSGYAAHHGIKDGAIQPHGEDSDDEKVEAIGGIRTRDARAEREADTQRPHGDSTSSSTSDATRVGERQEGTQYNSASGVRVDPEKGRDLHIVDWYGPDDAENPQNWSTGMFLEVVWM
jgi:DHA1 family multidrug resistance protein-like MFS transporter